MADFITTADYKIYKGKSSSTDDAKLSVLIPVATKYIKTYCKRTFIDYFSTQTTEFFDARLDKVFVKEFPIVNISSVAISIDAITYQNLTEYTDYFVDTIEGSISASTSAGFIDNDVTYGATPKQHSKSLRVTYTGGYQTIPDDIKMAAILLVDYYLDKQYIENKSINANVMQTFGAEKLPHHIRSILASHRELI